MSNIVPTTSLLPEVSEFNIMKELAKMSVNSGLLPQTINSPEKALIIMLKGRELGIPAMQAFSHIHVVNGKPTMSAELMLTQIYKCIPKVVINYIQSDDKACIIESQRPHSDKTKWSFTIQEAEKAQLLSKGPWKQYPAAMLRARAISIMARAQFPDCLNGVSYTAEELGAEIDIDDNGNEVIKDVTPKEKKENVPQKNIEPEQKPASTTEPTPKIDQQPQTKPPARKQRNFALASYLVPTGKLAVYPNLGKIPEAEAVNWVYSVQQWLSKPDTVSTPEIEEALKNVKDYFGLI